MRCLIQIDGQRKAARCSTRVHENAAAENTQHCRLLSTTARIFFQQKHNKKQ